eukprot:7272793-Prymnesium_polylepis.1
MARVRIQGQLCAQQAAWRAKQVEADRAVRKAEQHRLAVKRNGLAELAQVGQRLQRALNEVAPGRHVALRAHSHP